MVQVKIKIKGVRQLQKKFNSDMVSYKKAKRTMLNKASKVLKKCVEKEAPQGRTGRLKKTIKRKVYHDRGIVSVFSENKITNIVAKGKKRPTRINVKSASVLAGRSTSSYRIKTGRNAGQVIPTRNGYNVFGKWVITPPIAPNTFFQRGLKKAKSIIIRDMRREIKKRLKLK